MATSWLRFFRLPAAICFAAAVAVAGWAPQQSFLRRVGFPRQPLASSSVYSEPELYDLAFSYRDFDDEVDFLLDAHARHSGTGEPPRSILEVAAGPARHCLNAWRRRELGLERVAALDSSSVMVDYARSLGQQEKVPLQCFQGWMENFTLPREMDHFDAAWCLLGSAAHLLTTEAFVGMLRSVAAHLAPGGTLTVELPHPREVFRLDDVTDDGWDVPEGDNPLEIGAGQNGYLAVEWGQPDKDLFDPVTQVRQAHVDLKLERDGTVVQHVHDKVPQREFTLQELSLLAELSGVFAPPVFSGALTKREHVTIDDEERAFRMVAVMRRL